MIVLIMNDNNDNNTNTTTNNTDNIQTTQREKQTKHLLDKAIYNHHEDRLNNIYIYIYIHNLY